MKRYQTLFLEDIYVDDRVKMRANASPKLVAEYAEAMAEGEMFPPLVMRRGRAKCPRLHPEKWLCGCGEYSSSSA